MQVYVLVNAQDGCDMPISPDPIELKDVGEQIALFLLRYKQQGYYSNCRQQRLPLSELSFIITQED